MFLQSADCETLDIIRAFNLDARFIECIPMSVQGFSILCTNLGCNATKCWCWGSFWLCQCKPFESRGSGSPNVSDKSASSGTDSPPHGSDSSERNQRGNPDSVSGENWLNETPQDEDQSSISNSDEISAHSFKASFKDRPGDIPPVGYSGSLLT